MTATRTTGDLALSDADDLSERGCLLLQGDLAASTVRLIKPLTGGRSGARVWLCDISASVPNMSSISGQYVLKVSSGSVVPTGSASTLAEQLGNFAAERVPRLVRSVFSSNLFVELYDVAGHSLDTVRTAESVSDHLDRDAVHLGLASELLRAQLASGSVFYPSSVASVMEQWIGAAWLEGHRGERLTVQSHALNAAHDALFRHGAEMLPDPILVTEEVFAGSLDGMIEGICHGDLHEGNILVHGSRRTSDLTYWLIDFNWDGRAPLLYDQAYLECSLILNGLERMSNPALATVLALVDGVEPAAPASLDLAGSVLVNRIRAIRGINEQELDRAEGRRRDLWSRQILLARIAAALNWASKFGIDPELAQAAYLIAAWNVRTWLRTYVTDRWQALTLATPRKDVEPEGILPEAEILRLWSTFQLRNTGRDLFIVSGVVPNILDTSPVAHCAWAAVIDLDPASDVTGLASTVVEQLRLRRHVSVFGTNTQATGPRQATNWLMANGWRSRGEEPSSSREEWRRKYFKRTRDIIDVVHDNSVTGSAAVLVLQSDETDTSYSRIVEYIDESYQAAPEVLVLDVSSRSAQGIDGALFLRTVRTSLLQSAPQGAPTIPGSHGPVGIGRADLLRLEVDLEVLHSEKLADEGEAPIADDEFWRGRPPNWGELDAQIDLERDVYSDLRGEILKALDPPRLTHIPVYHSPGAGGTTLGRRAAWDLHFTYPTVRLRNCTDLTAERIDEIFRFSGKPVVVLAEASDLQPSDRDELFEKLRIRGTAAAIVLVTRSSHRSDTHHHLMDPMPLLECRRFIDAHLSRDLPFEAVGRLRELRDQLSDDSPSQYRSPFYIGLCAYDNEFKVIDRYVDHHLEKLSARARRVAIYLALVTRYAQFAIPPAVIRRWLGDTRLRQTEINESLVEILGSDLRHLVVATSDGARLLHPLIAQSVLVSPSGGGPQGLAQNAVAFIRELHHVLGASSYVARKMLADLFVHRAPISGHDRKGNFAEVIQTMTAEGGQLVFETLTTLYPREPHFWNHRGRYHIYVVKGDFSKAEHYLNNAVEQAGADAPLHQHTLGMVRRFWLENEIRDLQKAESGTIEAERLLESIRPLYDSAMQAFAQCRTGITAAYGLVTPLQLTAVVIEALVRTSGNPNLTALLATNSKVAEWIAGQIDEAEGLLDELHAAALEGTSRSEYYGRLTQAFDLLYGDIEALVDQWRAIKNDRAEESGALGLALARTIFAQNGRDWSDVSEGRAREIYEMLWETVSGGGSSDSDLRLWLQAYRRLPEYSETIALERLSSAAELGSLDAYYYLYVLSFMRWLRGDVQNQDRSRQFLEQCQRLARNKNRSWSYEWVAENEPAPTLAHFTELGYRPPGPDSFFSRPYLLHRLRGVIERIDGRQAGRIRLMPGTMTAHFVPRSKFLQTRDINTTVEFFLGFSYDGLRAWEVEYPGEYRGPSRPRTTVADLGAASGSSSARQTDTTDSDQVDVEAVELPVYASKKALRPVLDLVSCRNNTAGLAGDDAARLAIADLIGQCESAGARLDSLQLGQALQYVLGVTGYAQLKHGGKLAQAVIRLGFAIEQGRGAFYVTSGPERS